LDKEKFRECVDEHQSVERVEKDLELGRLNGVHVTPTIFVNGIRYEGDKNAEQLRAILEAAERGDVTPVSTGHSSTAQSGVADPVGTLK
jgi:predicted DsbA family dithiol-disulfide isomerase